MQTTPEQFAKKAKGLGQGKLGKVVTKVAKKGAGRLAGGPVATLAGMAYGAYKSGQKHSGGKAVKGQETDIVEKAKKEQGSIWDKKK